MRRTMTTWLATGILAASAASAHGAGSPAPVSAGGSQGGVPDIQKDIEQRVRAVDAKVIGWRRDIHEHPELSNQETRTAALVATHLRELGMDVTTGVAGTGVVGVLKGARPGKVLLLRADMDALPVREEVDLPFASKARGMQMGKEVEVMHACGHDGHTAILMGAAEVLAQMRDRLAGTIKFVFQPAEEGASQPLGSEDEHIGALAMIDAGVLENPHVDAAVGLHLTSVAPVGTIAYRPGPILASGNAFTVKVSGRQTHGAAPWSGIDPIVSSAQIIMGLQTIVSRQLNLTKEPAVLSIGSIQGGNRSNIIPDSVTMQGTLRTFDDDMRDDTMKRMRQTIESTAQASGAKAELKFEQPAYSTTVNDAALGELLMPVWKAASGDHLVTSPKVTASEDFSEFQKRVPGVFFFVGATAAGTDPARAAPNHSPRFQIDEASLSVGVRAMVGSALTFLGGT